VELVTPTVFTVAAPPTVVTFSVVEATDITPVPAVKLKTRGLVAVPQPVAWIDWPAWFSVRPACTAPPPSRLAKLQGRAEIVTGVATGVVVVPVVEHGSGRDWSTRVPVTTLWT
jgi:hypothetical protein